MNSSGNPDQNFQIPRSLKTRADRAIWRVEKIVLDFIIQFILLPPAEFKLI